MEKSKIRILYSIPNFDTAGSGIALMKLIYGLDRERFEPFIICLHNKGRYFEDVVSKSGVPVFIYPYLAPARPIFKLLKECYRISCFLKEKKIDILFSYHYGSDYSEAIASWMAGVKFLYVKKNMSWKGASYHGWKTKTFLSRAVVVQNQDMIKEFFPESRKAHLISIGVDTTEFFPKPYDRALSEELSITKEDKIILCVAHIVPKKGIDILIRGFSAMDNRNAKLLIVGDFHNELGAKMIELSLELGVGDRVLFLGKRNDVHRFFSIADLFILNSIGNEGAPIVIQEAMASGVVVITTNTPGNRDQLSELPDQLIKPNCVDSVSVALNRYLSIDQLVKDSIIDVQRKIVQNRYSLVQEIRLHQELYDSILKKK